MLCSILFLIEITERNNKLSALALLSLIFAEKKSIFGSNVYLFTLRTHFLKVKTLFFDINITFLIVNSFSVRL